MEIEIFNNEQDNLQQLMDELKDNGMEQAAGQMSQLLIQMDNMTGMIHDMMSEIEKLNESIQEIQGNGLTNRIKKSLYEDVERIEKGYEETRQQIFEIKDDIKNKAENIRDDYKMRGKVALNRILEFTEIKSKLTGVRDKMILGIRDIERTLGKIDILGEGMREARNLAANAIRNAADKETIDYSSKESSFSKTELIKRPWLAQKKLHESFVHFLDVIIDKIDDLSGSVRLEVDKEQSLEPGQNVTEDKVEKHISDSQQMKKMEMHMLSMDDQTAENLIKALARVDSAYGTSHMDSVYEIDQMTGKSNQNLYFQQKEECRLENCLVPKIGIATCLEDGAYTLREVKIIDERLADMIVNHPDQIDISQLQVEAKTGDYLLLKESIVEPYQTFSVTENGLVPEENGVKMGLPGHDCTEMMLMSSYDVTMDQQCVKPLVEHGVTLQPGIQSRFEKNERIFESKKPVVTEQQKIQQNKIEMSM